ncbi:hypothetical protein PT974_01005 [Cladobotryum mycophilum]|uniref:Uncharacterized protein n=1 Tax=Cladobotryum mycophilum TaxID=491253 RepID=A0ABR0T2G8_9HYPO
MDPDCAICHAPASLACDCEAKGLEVAVKQAEERMMRSIYNDIRTWVRAHAQDYILEYFRLLAERRKTAHSAHLDHITAHAFYHYNAPPHPNQIAEAQATLKRGIDEDWQASVQRYPEVLEYFYSLVELSLPADDEAAVKDPPLNANSGHRKANRRPGTIAGSSSAAPRPLHLLRLPTMTGILLQRPDELQVLATGGIALLHSGHHSRHITHQGLTTRHLFEGILGCMMFYFCFPDLERSLVDDSLGQELLYVRSMSTANGRWLGHRGRPLVDVLLL